MIKVDGVTYNIDVVSIRRKAEFLDKYAERTDDGILHRELIGVYFNYELTLDPGTDRAEYALLWAKLTEPTEFHTVTTYDESGEVSFTAYMSNVSDQLKRAKPNQTPYWSNLTVSFIAKAPARTP